MFRTLVASLKCSREQRAPAVEQTLTPLPQAHSQTWGWPRLHGPGSDTHPVLSKEGHIHIGLDSHCIF